MPDWLLERSTVIGLAIVGGVLSVFASWCQSRATMAQHANWINKAAYGFMAVSIVLFIGAGMFGAKD